MSTNRFEMAIASLIFINAFSLGAEAEVPEEQRDHIILKVIGCGPTADGPRPKDAGRFGRYLVRHM